MRQINTGGEPCSILATGGVGVVCVVNDGSVDVVCRLSGVGIVSEDDDGGINVGVVCVNNGGCVDVVGGLSGVAVVCVNDDGVVGFDSIVSGSGVSVVDDGGVGVVGVDDGGRLGATSEKLDDSSKPNN